MRTFKDIELPEGLKPSQKQLIGMDGNAFAIIGSVREGLRRAGNDTDTLNWFTTTAMESENYDEVIQLAMAVTDPDADGVFGMDER